MFQRRKKPWSGEGLNNFSKAARWLGFVKFLISIEIFESYLFFLVSILPSRGSKCWNFSDNLSFKGKIVAKSLIRSHFLPIYNNMAIKQQICLIKKYVTCVMAFTCVTRCQFYCIISPILFTKNNKLWNDKSENFLRIWLLCVYGFYASEHHVLLRKVENRIFRQNRIFRHTCMCKQPIFTKQ